MSESLRDALEEAYAKEEQETPPAAIEQEAAPSEEETAVVSEEEDPTEVAETESQAAESPAAEDTPKLETEVPEADTTAETQTRVEAEDSRPPAGWRGEAKQQWKDVPAGVQREILRREQEAYSTLRESAEARKFVDEFQQAVEPYRAYIEADRSTPIQAFQNLMQTAAGLRIGTPQQKAGIVSQIIKQYGVDIETLDSMLAGEAPAQAPEQDHLSRMLDERLAPVNQFMESLNQAKSQSEQRAQQSVQQEIAAFESDPANVYFEDVREHMAVLLDTAAQQGQEMSLKQAYDTAVMVTKGIQPTAPQGANGGSPEPQIPQDSLARKKLAAASVPGSVKAPTAPSPPEDLRGVLSAAWDAAQQR